MFLLVRPVFFLKLMMKKCIIDICFLMISKTVLCCSSSKSGSGVASIREWNDSDVPVRNYSSSRHSRLDSFARLTGCFCSQFDECRNHAACLLGSSKHAALYWLWNTFYFHFEKVSEYTIRTFIDLLHSFKGIFEETLSRVFLKKHLL